MGAMVSNYWYITFKYKAEKYSCSINWEQNSPFNITLIQQSKEETISSFFAVQDFS